MSSAKHRINRYTLAGLAAILFWSTTVALARSLSEQVGPLTSGAAVYVTGGVLLIAASFIDRNRATRLRQLSPLYVFGCGALFLGYTAALFLALGLAKDRTQSLEVGLVNYLWPALTILFSLVLLSKRARIGLLPGTLLSLLGVALVMTPDNAVSWRSFWSNAAANPAAYGLGALAALQWALYSNLTRRWASPNSRGAVPLFIVITGLAFWASRCVVAESGQWTARTAAEAAFLGLATALAYLFWDLAMRKGDVVLVASCSYLTPFFATAVGCIYLGVAPTVSLGVGCLLIIGGSFLSWLSVYEKDEMKSG
jgi:drug/metabolite transporter (DMT)-like permease